MGIKGLIRICRPVNHFLSDISPFYSLQTHLYSLLYIEYVMCENRKVG